MSTKAITVLLVGESAKGSSSLLRHLEKRGCECYVATSGSEAARLLVDHVFDLILCTDLMEGINALIASVVGSSTTLFRCYPVEDGCWWLPAVRHGEKCLGASALRPGEFASALDEIVDEIESGKHPRADCELGRQTAAGPHRCGDAEDAARWRR
jgi:hypothetical protein